MIGQFRNLKLGTAAWAQGGAAPESGESGHHAHARAAQYSIFEYWNTGKTRNQKTVG